MSVLLNIVNAKLAFKSFNEGIIFNEIIDLKGEVKSWQSAVALIQRRGAELQTALKSPLSILDRRLVIGQNLGSGH